MVTSGRHVGIIQKRRKARYRATTWTGMPGQPIEFGAGDCL